MTTYAWGHNPEGKKPSLLAWREEHPGQPDPDDATLQNWVAALEREGMLYEWCEAHPGRPIPDDAEVRQWSRAAQHAHSRAKNLMQGTRSFLSSNFRSKCLILFLNFIADSS